jgi:hypothetical protein
VTAKRSLGFPQRTFQPILGHGQREIIACAFKDGPELISGAT